MAYLSTRDHTKLYFNDMGGNGEPVVLIHGWPVSSAMWEYQALALMERGHRVVAYDRRGFGKSEQPRDGYNYDTLADDLKDLLDHLNVQSVKLVGFSMGGGEIARYLGRHGSSRVSKAVLISSMVPYMLKTADNPEGVPENVFSDIISGLKEDRPHFLAGFAKDFYGDSMIRSAVSKEILDWTAFMAYPASPKATIDCVTTFGKTDFRGDMKAFTMPTLIIHGSADKTVPPDAAGKQAAKMISKAILKMYDGAPHGLFVTHKNQLIEDLLGFLN